MTARAPLWCRRHVLVVHDLFVLSNPEWFSRAYVATHAWLLRSQIRRAAAIVAVSQPVAEQLSARYGGPVVVAPNAPSSVFDRRVGRPVENDDADQVLARLGLRRGQYLLTVGSMDPRKNLRRLAQAYAALPESDRVACPLVVVGGGSAVFRNEHLSWPAGVVDAGFVADEDLRYLYAGCRALVLVSQAEGFGLPLVEAAAAGAPGVVLSDIPVFRWICGDAAIYVDPSSTSSITAGLRRGIAEPRPLEIDLERFSWDASAETIGDTCARVRAA
jgi:glycosyltransferase involved in cell wall biosynthesis